MNENDTKFWSIVTVSEIDEKQQAISAGSYDPSSFLEEMKSFTPSKNATKIKVVLTKTLYLCDFLEKGKNLTVHFLGYEDTLPRGYSGE